MTLPTIAPVQAKRLLDPLIRDPIPDGLAFPPKRHQAFCPHFGEVLG